MTASISDDVRAIEEALADYEKAPRFGWPATNPARLRRVLDTMQALAGALRELNRQRIERVDPLSVAAGMAWSKAVAALALYEGKQ